MGAPTLIVGVGGIGGDIVRKLASRVQREGLNDVELVVMDTDVNDLRNTREKYPNIYTVQTSPKGTVGKALDQNEYARDRWFPLNDGLTGKPFTEGAGQVRAVSRLAFDHAVEQGLMENLEKAIAKLHGLTGDSMRQEMRIIITGSIAGGTGSGMVLPVAMYIRNFLITRYQDNSAIIRGFFLEPDVVFGRIVDEEERNTQRANAYAAVREMDAFFRKEYSGSGEEYSHVVFNAPQPGLGERVDYPNILPYHFVFLMDALNADGDSLTDSEGRYDLEGYKKHAADCIYAQALSAVSARSNSSEDNVIRKLAANNGRSRYCGAGSSCLEYPMKDVQKYIALSWANQTLSGEWLEIDKEFNKRSREDSNIQLSDFFVTEFESKRDGNIPFYKTIIAKTERKDDDGNRINPMDDYVENVVDHADTWAQDDLPKESYELKKILYNDNGTPRMKPLPRSSEEIQENSEDGEITRMIDDFFSEAKRYSTFAKEDLRQIVESHTRSAFSVSDFDKKPLESRNKEWQLENVMFNKEENQSGSYHPTAVRYMLYKLQKELKERRREAEDDFKDDRSKMDRLEKRIASKIDEINMSFDDGKKKGIKLPIIGKDKMNEDTIADLGAICQDANKFKDATDKYITHLSEYYFLDSALTYVSNLVGAYEAFYDHMGKEIEGVRKGIDSIENNVQFNDSKGRAHRYVCASKECLHKMLDECRMRSSSGDLPIELCGDIYTSLLRYSKAFAKSEDYASRNAATSELFKRLFNEVVIDYWMNAVLSPQIGYPGIIDKSIVQAMGDEAVYLSDTIYYDTDDETSYVETYVLRTLEEADQLSTPFIEPPVGEVPRNIKTCAFSEDAFKDAGPYAEDVKRVLINSYNGTEVPSREFSKYEILFYSSLYGFCATNLPKYAPQFKGLEMRPEGEYHRAYFATVNQLSPNLKENRLITPHIDKNWHLVCALPDLNEDNEKSIMNDIVHSFLFGLIFQQFDAEPVLDGDDVYYIKATSNHPRTNLWVSNGTPCDRFYEVFDALKFSPPAVYRLLEESNKRLVDEMNATLALSISQCHLLKRIRSDAFTDYHFEAWMKKLEGALEAFTTGRVTEANKVVPFSLVSGAIDSTLVTNLFGYGNDNPETRTSIFEIPLLYRISLPQTELRDGEIDMMVESIFNTVEAHLSNFCDDIDLTANCCRLFEEQYLLFEYNLIGYESEFENSNANIAVSIVREKVLSYLEDSPKRSERISTLQNRVKSTWKQYRDNRKN